MHDEPHRESILKGPRIVFSLKSLLIKFTPFLVAAIFSAVVLTPIAIHPGWPQNHEHDAPLRRMLALASQWHLHHWIPTWSPELQMGFGSPMLGVYHKSFTYLSTFLLELTNSNKLAILGALWIVMCAAFLGAYSSVRAAAPAALPVAAVIAGAVLIVSSYVTLDWLIRGAFAEFTALAVATWIMAWALTLIKQGKWGLSIGPLIALLLVSHIVLAIYCLPILITACLVAILKHKRSSIAWIRSAVISIFVSILLASPFLLPVYAMQGILRTYQLTVPEYTPEGSHQSFLRIFSDPGWHWGYTWSSFTIKLDTILLILTLVFFAIAIFRKTVQSMAIKKSTEDFNIVIFLAVSFAIYLILQMRWTLPFYRISEIFSAIQFTWRLQTFVTMLAAISVGLLLNLSYEINRTHSWSFGLHTVAGIIIVLLAAGSSPWIHPIKYEWMDSKTFDRSDNYDYLAGNEYLPITNWPKADRLTEIAQLQNFLDTRSTTCITATIAENDASWAKKTFAWNCKMTNVRMPAFWAPGFRALALDQEGKKLRTLSLKRSCEDPRITIAPPPQGTKYIQLIAPTWRSTIVSLLNTDRYPCR